MIDFFCIVCKSKLEQLYNHDRTLSDIYCCPNSCKTAIDQVLRYKQERIKC